MTAVIACIVAVISTVAAILLGGALINEKRRGAVLGGDHASLAREARRQSIKIKALQTTIRAQKEAKERARRITEKLDDTTTGIDDRIADYTRRQGGDGGEGN